MNEELKRYIKENELKYYIETYGCQMNVHDSEKIAGTLESFGFVSATDKDSSDLLIFNTCCVREHAEARVYGNIGALKEYKASKPDSVIAVCGCMMQQEGAAEKLQRRFPHVDITFGTNQLQHFESMLYEAIIDKKRTSQVEENNSVIEIDEAKRNGAYSAFVNIIYGCNNFCSYCIVPYVRGRERSRLPEDIIREINGLCKNGVSEITLLGQNVNSYGNDLDGDVSFPKLLERIDGETDIKRLRFMTSHPKDLTDELISCYGRLNSLCEHIHLPVQSGSDAVLKAMNRGYSREHYINLVDKLRQQVPDIAITTDIIVGFPGETEEDFERTVELVKTVRFDAAYTFAYSKRGGTKAALMPQQHDRKTKSERLAKLNSVVHESMLNNNERYLGIEVEILAESMSSRNENEICGRTRSAKTVSFKGSENELGKYMTVKINKIKAHTLYGTR